MHSAHSSPACLGEFSATRHQFFGFFEIPFVLCRNPEGDRGLCELRDISRRLCQGSTSLQICPGACIPHSRGQVPSSDKRFEIFGMGFIVCVGERSPKPVQALRLVAC